MCLQQPIRLFFLLTGTFAFAGQLPVVFEPGVEAGQFVARLGTSAVGVSAAGIAFDSTVALRFQGGARVSRGELEERLPGSSGYFLGNDRTKWRPAVPHYGRLRFREVYPGIDVVYYGRGGKLEYDFVLAAGAEVGRIQIEFRGVTVAPTVEGDLLASASACNRSLTVAARKTDPGAGGERRVFVQRRPRVLQDGRELEARYRLRGQVARLEIAGRDAARALVIDPVIESATYLGGGSYEAAKAIKLDAQGNVYLAGQAPSPGVFGGPFPSATNPGVDVALIKFAPQSNTILYYKFLGGDGDDIVNSLAVDATGAAYVAGSTRSANFPVANGFQMNAGSTTFSDAFVAKIAADGNSLVYSSYLGGSGADEALALAVDPTGAAYVGGSTGSRNFPVQSGAFQSTFGGSILSQSATGFLAVIAPAGNKITYATLLGGSRQEQVRAIALDSSGNVYAGGSTSSFDFPVRGGAQITLPGLVSGFVAKFSSDLSQVVYASFVGGQSTTVVNALTVDPQGAAIAAGHTSSPDFPVRLAPQVSYGGGDRDGFLARLTPQGGDYLFATYLGGSDIDTINDLTLEANGLLTVVGSTASADFPQHNGLQTFEGRSPNQDAFVAKFLNNSLVFSTLLGGTGDDQAFGVQADAAGGTYIAGVTGSTDFPVKAGGYQTQYGGGGGDMFFVKLSADPALTGTLPTINVSPTVVSFVAAQGAAAPPAPGPVGVTAVNGSVSFTVDWSGGSWLSASLTHGDAPATIEVFANQAGLAVGVYTGTVRVTPTSGSTAVIINVTLTVANAAPVVTSISPAQVATGSPDTDFTMTGSGFTSNSTVQVLLDDGSPAQTITPSAASDTTLRVTLSKSLLFRDTLLQLRVKDPGSPNVSNTIAVQVGNRFPTIASVVNAASVAGTAIAPGEYVSIAGSTLGPALPLRVLVGDGAVASTLLGGVRVLFDGMAAPLLSVVDRKVVAVAPWSLAGRQTTQVVVEYLGVQSNPMGLAVTQAAPAIFTVDGTGGGQGLIFNDSGLSNAGFLPAAKGSQISFYFTGAGVMAPGGVDGKISGSTGGGPVLPVTVTIDGLACEVVAIGNALGEVSGMVQASVRVPAAAHSGSSIPIQVTVGGVPSQAGVVVAVQ